MIDYVIETGPRDRFYLDMARDVGGLAEYYLGELRACVAAHVGEPDYYHRRAVIAAREAWHFALRLTPDAVDAELARIAQEDRDDIPF